MSDRDRLPLNTHFLVRRLRHLDLKQGWVAREIGVDRKTVNRWATGRVKRIERDNAEHLATLLDCSVDDLTLSADHDVLATRDEQHAAARLIEEGNLLALVSPTDEWELAEGLIRAALLPDLPLRRLGSLYNLLSTVEWRRGRYDDARRHARHALQIAERVGDHLIEIKAVFNEATIESFVGNVGEALRGYERVLAIPEAFDSPRGRASTYSNLGCLYLSFRRFEDAIATQQKAIDGFAGADFNLAIAWTSMGVAQCESGAFDDALQSFDHAAACATRSRYERGRISAQIYRADVQSLRGDRDAAHTAVVAALPGLTAFDVVDLGNRESAARVLRRARDFAAADAQLNMAMESADTLPELAGRLGYERARWHVAQGDLTAGERAQKQADTRFREAGLAVRVQSGPLREHGGGELARPAANSNPLERSA